MASSWNKEHCHGLVSIRFIGCAGEIQQVKVLLRIWKFKHKRLKRFIGKNKIVYIIAKILFL